MLKSIANGFLNLIKAVVLFPIRVVQKLVNAI